MDEMFSQREKQKPSSASSAKCSIYHYGSIVALCGYAAHVTGGVSDQDVNSALVDSTGLEECLEFMFDASKKESQRQVPEGYALYEISFAPSPKSISQKARFAVNTVRDTMFKGRCSRLACFKRRGLPRKTTSRRIPYQARKVRLCTRVMSRYV
jgi:hypothetical protein